MTKQHVWPEWLKKHNVPNAKSHLQLTLRSQPGKRLEDAETSVTRKQGHAGSKKFRMVCRTCNEGWIRTEIEEPVAPLVLKLMAGTPTKLDRDSQKMLAAWLTVVTIMAERTDPATMAIPAEDRRMFYQTKTPPPGWQVYVATYGGNLPGHHGYRHFACRTSEDVRIDAEPCDTQVSAYVFGHLCAHTFRSTIIEDFGGYKGMAVRQIWPIVNDPINWPITPALNDRGVASFASALMRAIPEAV